MPEQQPSDWQRRFQDMKVGFDRSTKTEAQPLKEINVNFPNIPNIGVDSLYRTYQNFLTWFNEIPASGKLLAIVACGLFSMTIVKSVFQLITSLITLSTFGIILYLIYRFSILPKGND
jgi:hypothetical protein